MAQRVCGGGVCDSSVAGGIGGLGRRAQGRFERVFFHADARGLRPLCAPPALDGPLWRRGAVLRPGTAVQEHAGDDALRPPAAGLLAAEPSFRLLSSGFAPAGGRENPAVCADGRIVRGDGPGSGESDCWPVAFRAADGKRRGVLRHLPLADDPSIGTGVCLSQPGKLSAALAGGRGTGVAAGHIRSGMGISPDASLPRGRLALVSGDDDPGDRDCADILLRPCGSLHLSAADRLVSVADLGGGGSVRRLASPPRGAGRRRHGHSGGFDFLRAHADFLLAE